MERLRLQDVITDMQRLLTARFRHHGIVLAVELPEDLPWVWGVASQLERVFLNLLVNAWQAMPEGGTVTIDAEVVDDQHVAVWVHDTGRGMSAEALNRAFEPGFSANLFGFRCVCESE